MSYILILVLILVAHISSQSFGCTVWEDSFLSFENDTFNPSMVLIDIHSHSQAGWMGVGFGDSSNTLDWSMVAFYPNNVHFFSSHKNYSQSLNYTGVIEDSTANRVHGVFRVTIQVPKSSVDGKEYIHFARSISETPLSIDVLSFHESYGSRLSPHSNSSLQIFDQSWCNSKWLKLPGRVAALHIGALIPISCILLLCCVLALWLRDEQPLKSRGESPIVISIIYIEILVVEYTICWLTTYEQSYFYECWLTSLGIYPGMLIIGVTITLQYARYMMIININVQKDNVSQSTQKLSLLFRIINRLTRPRFIPIVQVSMFVIYLIFFFIWNAIFEYRCGTWAATLCRITTIVLIVILILFVFLLQIWDLWTHRIALFRQCQWIDHLFKHDNFFFRLEFGISPFLILPLALWIVPFPTWASILIVDVLFFVTYMLAGGFVLIVTVLKYITKREQKRSSSSEILSLFSDHEILALFAQHAKNEWSYENVAFIEKNLQYLKSTGKERERLCKEIVSLFLSYDNSLYEINCRREDIENTIKRADQLEDDLFMFLQKNVLLNLTDVHARFIRSNSYLNYIAKMKMVESVVNQN